MTGVELTSFDVDVMLDQWLIYNPMPVITDGGSFQQCVEKCMWNLKMAEARAELYGVEFPLNVEAYKWNIEQKIINRAANKSMLSAGLDYVSNLLETLDL